MERVPQLVRRGKKDRRMGAPSELDWEAIEALRTEMRVELIQELIPLGLAEVGRVLDEEVERFGGSEARPQGRRRSDLPAWEQPGLGTPGRAASSDPGPSGARSGGRGASGVVRALALGGGRGGRGVVPQGPACEVPPVAVPLPMLDPEPSVVPGVGAS